jgi:hypothetical protein
VRWCVNGIDFTACGEIGPVHRHPAFADGAIVKKSQISLMVHTPAKTFLTIIALLKLNSTSSWMNQAKLGSARRPAAFWFWPKMSAISFKANLQWAKK